MKERRIGKFFITKELMGECDIEKTSQLFSLLGFVPLRVEFIYSQNSFEMVGISKFFDYLELGYKVQSYDIITSSNDDGIILGVSVEKNDE